MSYNWNLSCTIYEDEDEDGVDPLGARVQSSRIFLKSVLENLDPALAICLDKAISELAQAVSENAFNGGLNACIHKISSLKDE